MTVRKILSFVLTVGLASVFIVGDGFAQSTGEKILNGIIRGINNSGRTGTKSTRKEVTTTEKPQPRSIAETAKETLAIGKKYTIKVSSESPTDLKIVTSEDGTLTLSFETFAEEFDLALYNENGVSLKPTSTNIVSGNTGRRCNLGDYTSVWGRKDRLCLMWDNTVQKFIGSFSFTLDGGTYYLRTIRSQTGISTAELQVSLEDLYGNLVGAGGNSQAGADEAQRSRRPRRQSDDESDWE